MSQSRWLNLNSRMIQTPHSWVWLIRNMRRLWTHPWGGVITIQTVPNLTEVFSFTTAAPLITQPQEWSLTLRWLLPGDEECAQGGSGVLGLEAAELPPAQAVAVPGPELSAHHGPSRTVHPEGGLSGGRGRQGGGSRPGGQPLSTDDVKDWILSQIPKMLKWFCCSSRAWSVLRFLSMSCWPPPPLIPSPRPSPLFYFTELTRPVRDVLDSSHVRFIHYFDTHLKIEDEG